MSKPSRKLPVSRLTIAIPTATRILLDGLVARSGATSVTEVIGRSARAFDALLTANHDGYDIVFRNGKGSEKVLVIT